MNVQSYTTTGSQMAVTFEIEEAAWNMGIILDNFVWFSDDQLIAAVRKDVPSFDGLTAPMNAGAADFIAAALQNLLRARSLSGAVVFTTQTDIKKGVTKYLFTVKDPSPKVCALRAQGSAAIPERELLEPLNGVLGGDYSGFFLTTAVNGTLLDMYRHRGFLRASFGPPSLSLDACHGVGVTLTVTEGPVYAWDHAEWTGNQALPANELDLALAMKKGQTADTSKVDQGLRDVHTLYETRGYMLQASNLTLRLDDASRTAVSRFTVDEGPQFRMGTLQFERLSEKDASTLRSKWTLQAGDVFDASYLRKYQLEVLAPLRTSSGGRAMVQMDVDGRAKVVNVRVAFE